MSYSHIVDISAQEFSHRTSEKLRGGRYPLYGQWELTCRCNLSCVMCYTDPYNKREWIQQELNYPEVVRIMDQVKEAGCLELCLTGGEPLARSDFLDIYTYAKQKGFLLTVFTNGTLITKKIADLWVQHPPSMIEISLHGLRKKSFESITQAHGSYERCLAGISLLLERNLPLTLKTTGLTMNRDEVLKIKELVSRLGNAQYKFGSEIRPRLNGSEDVYRYQLRQEEIAMIEQADPEFRAERIRQDRRKAELVCQGKELCAGGKLKFHIDAYGQLQLCSNNRRQGYDLRRGSFREGFYEFLQKFACPDQKLIAPGEPRTTATRLSLREEAM